MAQGGIMAGPAEPRFKSREAALRFYFRASELLTPNAKPGMFSRRSSPKPREAPNIVDDLRALDSCFSGLSEVQLWLLHELYRPGGFSTRARPVAEIFEAAQRVFPGHEWTPQKISSFKQRALRIFEAHLKRERLV
jgi:hypothetical protein